MRIILTFLLALTLHAQTYSGFNPGGLNAQVNLGSVPAAYQPTYNYLYNILVPKRATADAIWQGPNNSLGIGNECMPCDQYGALSVSTSEQFLLAQKTLGNTWVKMIVSAPTLYPPFYTWCASDSTCSTNNPGLTYSAMLTQYQTIVAYAQSIGLKVDVQEDVFPEGSVGSQTDTWNLLGYYATLATSGCPGLTSTCGYYTMRVTNTTNALTLAPNLLTVFAEPSTEGQKALPASDYIYSTDNPSTWVSSSAQMATGISAAIEASGASGLHSTLLIDMGDASFDSAAHITSLDNTYLTLASHHGVDCIENHVHPIVVSTNDPLANTLSIFALAAADSNPRPVCLNETSLYIETTTGGSTQAVENLRWPCYATSLLRYFDTYISEISQENNAMMVSYAYGDIPYYCVPDPATCASTSCSSTANPHVSANIATSPVTYGPAGTTQMSLRSAGPSLPASVPGGKLTGTIGYNVAASSPSITTSTPFEVSGGFSAFIWPSSLFNLTGADPMQVSLQTAGTGGKAMPIACFDAIDSGFAGSSSIYYDLAGRTNFAYACQRDVVNKQVTFEVWNLDGSNYSGLLTNAFTTLGGPLNFGGFYSGYSAGTGSATEKWVKIWTGISAPGTFPPTRGTGNILDISFTGSSVVNALSPAPSSVGVVSFPAITPNAPYLNIGNPRTVTGTTATLTAQASSLSGGTITNYFWRELSGPSTLTLGGQTTASLTISGMVFGDYKMLCRVLDSKGLTTVRTVDIGWVSVDGNGFVNSSPAYVTQILGPMLPLGSSLNQWPYYDSITVAGANYFASLQSASCPLSPDGCYVPYWQTFGAGTVTATNGSTTLTFSGVNPAIQFCGGASSTTPNGTDIVLNYSGSHYYPAWSVNACTSTTLTIGHPWALATASGVHYGQVDSTTLGNLSGQGTNANYYDSGAADYALYWRSGLTQYKTAGDYITYYWANQPYVDQGAVFSDPNGDRILHPRQFSFKGILLAALSGQSSYWPILEAAANYYRTYAAGSNPMTDTREQSYAMYMMAALAAFDPTSATAATNLANAQTYWTNIFETSVKSDGSYPELSFGESSWNGAPGTVSVTNGSTTVTGTGTTWNGSEANLTFWSTTQSSPTANSFGDAAPAYLVSSVNTGAQTLTLSTPYTGSTASGKYWQVNNLVGIGNQPYMMGIEYEAFRTFSLTATTSTSPTLAQIQNRMNGIAAYLENTSYAYTGSPEYGIWYGVGFPNCSVETVCSGSAAEPARVLTGEVLGALSDYCYRLATGAACNALTTMGGAMFSGPANGYSGASVGNITDGNYVYDLNVIAPGVVNPTVNQWEKYFPFLGGGYGNNFNFPAVVLLPHS